MDLVPEERASARSDEPEARSAARWRGRAAEGSPAGGSAAAVGGAAALAAPALAPFAGGDGGDDERGDRVGPPPAEGGVERESDEQGGGEVGAEHVLPALAVPGVEPSWRATLALALARSGIAIRVTIERPIPTGLLAGCSPLASVMVASTVMYAASSQKVIAMSCWARRSAVSESARVAAKRHSTMIPASASISESAPNAISAIDPATAPAAIAMAASMPCQTRPPRARRRARAWSRSRSGSRSAGRSGRGWSG